MEDLVKRGYVRSIGLSNFNATQVAEISAMATVQPAVNQVESHPYLPQEELKSKCLASNGVSLTAYSPLGSPDRPWATEEDPKLLEDPKLQEIAKVVGKSVAQVLLRFQVQRNVVAIPKSVTPKRIVENLEVRSEAIFLLLSDYRASLNVEGCADIPCHLLTMVLFSAPHAPTGF
jgi:diketogulonate reductase-like aldo/keto reductase